MSLMTFDDLLFPERQIFTIRPFRQSPLFSNALSDSWRQLAQMERELGQLETNAKDGTYTFNCSVAGYLPEELKVGEGAVKG